MSATLYHARTVYLWFSGHFITSDDYVRKIINLVIIGTCCFDQVGTELSSVFRSGRLPGIQMRLCFTLRSASVLPFILLKSSLRHLNVTSFVVRHLPLVFHSQDIRPVPRSKSHVHLSFSGVGPDSRRATCCVILA